MKRIILAFTAMLLLVGCGYNDEEKKLMKDYEKQGKTNAIEYVQNKYGITPEVTGINVLKVNTGPVPDFTPPPTGMVNALMKYDDIEFTVNITGEEKSLKGRDDYQKGEIENDIKLILDVFNNANVSSFVSIFFISIFLYCLITRTNNDAPNKHI